MRLLPTALAFVLLTLVSLPLRAEIIDRIVGKVNDEVVTLYDVRQAAVPFLLQQGRSPAVLEDPAQRRAILKEVLEDLVDRKLLLQEASKLELTIGDKELDQWLAFTRQQQGLSEEQFAQMIAGYGMRIEAYREMVRENLLKIRMIKIKVGSQVNVTQDEVDAVYHERYGSDDQEQFVTVSHILFRPVDDSREALFEARKRAAVAYKRVKQGEDFATVAREASDGPTAEKGGALGTFRRGELDPEFEAAAFDLPPQGVSKVTKTKFGFHIIKVDAVEMRESPDAEDRKDQLRGELQQRAMEQMLEQYLQTLRTRAFVDIRY